MYTYADLDSHSYYIFGHLQMEIQEETPIYKEGESQYSLLRYAAMAAKWKEPPRDALDTLTLGAVS